MKDKQEKRNRPAGNRKYETKYRSCKSTSLYELSNKQTEQCKHLNSHIHVIIIQQYLSTFKNVYRNIYTYEKMFKTML